MAHEVHALSSPPLAPPVSPHTPHLTHCLQIALRDDVIFRHSAFVRGAQHAIDPQTHSQMLSDVAADPKMTWITPAIGALQWQGQALHAGRDERADAVVCRFCRGNALDA